MRWQDLAACVETPVPFRAVIDGEFLGTVDSVSVAVCKRVCSGCSARDACFEHGIQHVGTAGVYGGLTWQERRTVARKVRARGGYVNVTDRVIRDSTANVPSNKRVAAIVDVLTENGPMIAAQVQRHVGFVPSRYLGGAVESGVIVGETGSDGRVWYRVP